jgi:hypothetical protein
MRDLNALAGPLPSGWALTAAVAIDDSGQIACLSDHNGQRRSFLLTPIPEPSTLAALVAGIVAGASLWRLQRGRWFSARRDQRSRLYDSSSAVVRPVATSNS